MFNFQFKFAFFYYVLAGLYIKQAMHLRFAINWAKRCSQNFNFKGLHIYASPPPPPQKKNIYTYSLQKSYLYPDI